MSRKTALLIGGSGLIWGHCLAYLLADDHYDRVKALVRHPLAAAHPKLIQHQVNFERLQHHFAGIQADDVYCCLGSTLKKAGSQSAFYRVDFTYPAEIARLSLKNGAEQFLLVSALGADPESSIFYNRVKGEIEQAIAGYGFSGFYIFRPSLLLGARKERRPAEELGKRLLPCFSFVFKGPLKRYKPIEAQAVASAMVTTAKAAPRGKQIFESSRIHALYKRH